MKWYTAIGVKQNQWDGRFHIQVGKEDKILIGMEICLWSSLLWSFCEEQQVYNRMTAIMQMMNPKETSTEKLVNKEEYQFCFRRLCTRGILCWVEAESKERAAGAFIRKSMVLPIKLSFGTQLGYFINSMAYGNGFRISKNVFMKQPLSPMESYIWNLFERNESIPLRTKDIIKQTMEINQGGQEDILGAMQQLYEKKKLSIWKVEEEKGEI